jgi:MFS transporter, PHS family, inorganic phosphate transporter
MKSNSGGGNAAFHNFERDFAHIADHNERRRLALAEIDKAPFGWYHVRAVVVAGVDSSPMLMMWVSLPLHSCL